LICVTRRRRPALRDGLGSKYEIEMNKSTLAGILTLLVLNAGCGGPVQYVERGNKFLEAKRYADAEISYKKAIQKDPKLGEAYYGLGNAQIEEKNFPAAYQSLRRASELLPRRVDIKVKLADVVLGAYQSKPGDAGLYSILTKVTNEILSLDPNSYDGLRMKGNLALFDRKPEQAIQSFRRANEIKPLQEYVVIGYSQALIQAGRGPEAERLARQLIERKKDFGPIYDVLYQYYRSTGNTAAAEEVLRTRVRNNPKDSSAFIQAAAYYRQAKETAAMQAVIEDLVKGYVTRPDAFLAAGDFYSRYGDWEAAASAYERGSQIEASQVALLKKRLAAVRIAQKRPAEALVILDQVLAKTPTDWEAALLKADVLRERAAPGDLDKAIEAYQVVLKLRLDDPVALLGLGQAYFAKNDLVSARKTLLSARQKNPTSEEPKRFLAMISLREGKPAEALTMLDELLRGSPGSTSGRYLKINALMELGRYDEARPELDKLAHEFPQSSDLKLMRGLLAVLSKRYQDAEAIFSTAAASGGSDVRFDLGLAEAYAGRQQYDRALQLLETEVRRSPQQPVIRRMLAKTALQAGQFDRAISELQKLLQAQPDSATLLTDLGQAYRAKGDLPMAAQEFQKAIQRGSKDPLPYFLLGFTLDASGKPSEAIQTYRQALVLRPNDSLTMNNLAYALADSANPKDLDEALQLAQRALEISPREPDLRDTLGWVWLKKGKPDTALQLFTELCRDTPANPSYRLHLGLALLAKGNTGGAQKTLEQALASNPSQTEAVEIRSALRRASSER
jgi:tetratricopeptide (TPR) repeat protein